MIRCYVDNQAVQSPEGLDGIKFQKIRNPAYWGFLYRAIGYTDGGTLTFTQQTTVDYLRQAYRRSGILAQTSFRLVDDGQGVLYDGWINYAASTRQPGRFSLTLRDDQTIAVLESQATQLLPLDPAQTITLSGRQLDGGASLTLDGARATVRRSLANGRSLRHSVPLAPASDKEQSVAGTVLGAGEPLDGGPFYRNTTGAPVTLTLRGSFAVRPAASGGVMVYYRLYGPAAGPVTVGGVGTVDLTSTAAPLTVLVDQVVDVPAGGSLSLLAETNVDVQNYAFVYSSVSLTLARLERSPDSLCAGMPVALAFEQLVARLTGSKLRVVCRGLDDLFLTSGSNLRGVPAPLLVSLRGLFDGLSALFCLRLDVSGDVVTISPRTELYQRGLRSQIRKLTSLTETPNLELLFSTLTVGYTSGTATNSLLSGLEPNTTRTYASAVTTERSPLNLISDLITAGGRIEEQRRKQFSGETASADKADGSDNALFLICTRNGRSAGLAGIDRYDGLLDAPTSYNLRLTPRRCLERWRWLLAGAGALTLTHSETRQDVLTRYVGEPGVLSENEATIKPPTAFVPDKWQLRAPMNLRDYAALGDWIMLPDGREALLMQADWQTGSDGEQADLICWTMPTA